jgi:hypothetical protein
LCVGIKTLNKSKRPLFTFVAFSRFFIDENRHRKTSKRGYLEQKILGWAFSLSLVLCFFLAVAISLLSYSAT